MDSPLWGLFPHFCSSFVACGANCQTLAGSSPSELASHAWDLMHITSVALEQNNLQESFYSWFSLYWYQYRSTHCCYSLYTELHRVEKNQLQHYSISITVFSEFIPSCFLKEKFPYTCESSRIRASTLWRWIIFYVRLFELIFWVFGATLKFDGITWWIA